MKKIIKNLFYMIFGVVLVAGVFSGVEVKAASKNDKALKAYADFLEDSEYEKFALADINRDGVKELFVEDSWKGGDCLYIYKSGKVDLVDDFNWSWDVAYYPNKNYIVAERVGVYDDYTAHYRLSKKGKITMLAEKSGVVNFENGNRKVKYTYKLKGKKVTKKKYNSYVKKLKKNAKRLKLKYHENTYENRSKYLHN